MVRQNQLQCLDVTSRAGMTAFFFLLGTAWIKSRAESSSVSEVN